LVEFLSPSPKRLNCHVRDKIRQQLQVLRDAKLLVHIERGVWRFAVT
jgi:hypothetical protein